MRASIRLKNPALRVVEAQTPVEPHDDLTIIKAITECRKEAFDAKRSRMRSSKANRDAYLGVQDWSHKIKGQSKEFLPKLPLAVEQMASFVKKALVGFGDWFQVSVSEHSALQFPLTPEEIRALVKLYIDNLPNEEGNGTTDFSTRLTDAIKVGCLESLMILKIYGGRTASKQWEFEEGTEVFDLATSQIHKTRGRLVSKETSRWRLRIDLVRPEDYYPDPTGRGLYEIQSTEKDLHTVVEWAEAGVYDKEAVLDLAESMEKPSEERRREEEQNQDQSKAPSFRKVVLIDEFWGTILNSDGEVVHHNVFCTLANRKYLIRKPKANPFWHGESPFVVAPMIRVPFSVWHKALFDHASSLNLALNELYNLMLDGAIGSVWGISQIRANMLDNPKQVSGGVPQGTVLKVKDELPQGTKVMETCVQAVVPQDAMAMYAVTNSEFTSSALSNELRLGQLPVRPVKATEVVSLENSQSATLDGITADVENELVAKALKKGWACILQFADDLYSPDVVAAVGAPGAVALMTLKPEERFALMGALTQFDVFGLSSVLNKAREFQKQAAFLQLVMQNPLLLRAFIQKYSADKHLSTMMKSMNINPQDMQKSKEEQAQTGQEMQDVQNMGGGQGGPSQPAAAPGNGNALSGMPAAGSPIPAEINQLHNPLSGMER